MRQVNHLWIWRRKKAISSIETEMTKVKAELSKTQQKYDMPAAKLLELQKQYQAYEAEQIMDAYAKSGKSYRELMTFLRA